MPKSNKKIDYAIVNSRWALDEEFALQALSQYFHELELLEKGADFKDLKYAQRRAACLPTIIHSDHKDFIQKGAEGLSSSDIPYGSIAHLRLQGVMRLNDGISSRGVQTIVTDIQKANANPRVAGVLFDVDSGGGQLTAGDVLQNAITDFNKPFLTYFTTLGSAALKATLASDLIWGASATSRAGSIGVMLTINKWLAEFYKKEEDDIYATKSKNKNKEWRAYQKGDKKPFIKTLDDSNGYFHQAVKAWRNLKGDEATIEDTLSGHMFHAPMAIERGLVDGIGTFNQAVEQLQGLIDEYDFQKRKPRSNGSFNNQNKEAMNFKEWLKSFIPSLNAKFNLSIKEDASPEDVTKAVESAKSIDDIKAEVKADLEAEQKKYREEMEAKIKGLEEKLEKQQQDAKALEGKVEKLEASKKELEEELVDLKGEDEETAEDGTKEKKGSAAPDVSQFQTANNFAKALQPDGESEF